MYSQKLLALAAIALVAGCTSVPPASPPPAIDPAVFTLFSPGFADGAALPDRYAGNLAANPNCTGQNVSPPLQWLNVPAGTKSLAMIVHDQEGRGGLGVAHWVAYGISPALTGFAENEISQPSPKYVGGKSTLNLPVYMGPCPPAKTGWHHYVYTVIATDMEPGELPAGLTLQELMTRLAGKAKVASSIVLRYGRS